MCLIRSMSHRVLSLPSSVGSYVAHGQDFFVARLLWNLCNAISKEIGWVWDEHIQGMNFSTPMAEVSRSECVVWTKYNIKNAPGNVAMECFTRKPFFLRNQRPNLYSYQRQRSEQVPRHSKIYWNGFRLTIPGELKIPANTHVNVFVEFTAFGISHHYPYFGYFKFGLWSNLDDMLRVGIRIEWQVGGKWYSEYLRAHFLLAQAPKPFFGHHPEYPHISLQYTRYMELFSSLFQVKW